MPRFAANLTMLFNEVPFIERFAAAASAGFRGVEFQFPYDHPKPQLAEQLARHGLTLVLHNLPAGDWAAGDRGIACHPDRISEFEDGVGRAIEYAIALGCPRLNCLAGIAPHGVDGARVRETFVSNLRFAADELARAGLALMVEAINAFDVPGFYLNRSRQALDLIAAAGRGNIFLQYDIYHMQRMEGELAATIERELPRIGHLQLADNPGRNEPGTGEINYPFLFDWLDQIGYSGWIGCEYRPRASTLGSLGWARRWLPPSAALPA